MSDEHELTEDDMWALDRIAVICRAIAASTGLTAEEVYDLQFDGRAWTVSEVDGKITVEFDDEVTTQSADVRTDTNDGGGSL